MWSAMDDDTKMLVDTSHNYYSTLETRPLGFMRKRKEIYQKNIEP